MIHGYTIPLFALRQALQAVKPFADAKDDELGYVRLHPTTTLTVYATDRFAAALADVPITERDTDLAEPLDLAVGDVDKVLAVFKMPGDKDQWGNAAVQISPARSDDVTIVDASGLFEGQSLTLPAHQATVPDVRRMVNAWLRELEYREAGHWGASQRFLMQLNAASKTFGEPAYLHQREHRPTPWWVATIGDSFIAGAMPVKPDMFGETDTPLPVHTHRQWRNKLAGVGPWEEPRFATSTPTTVTLDEAGVRRLRVIADALGDTEPEEDD